jgi:hypothetical protein
VRVKRAEVARRWTCHVNDRIRCASRIHNLRGRGISDTHAVAFTQQLIERVASLQHSAFGSVAVTIEIIWRQDLQGLVREHGQESMEL